MKKILAFVAPIAAPVLAFAEGTTATGTYTLDTAEVDAMLTGAQTGLESFVSTNAPVIGGICFGFLVFTLIFVGLKLIKRASKSA